MGLTLPGEAAPSRVFTKFSDLPAEIRCQIWSFASPSRPRVVQVSYNPEKEIWRSWLDACGGLPSIIPVCREARQEALKPYTRLFETYIDLEEDTIFISDPIFTVRKPRSIFMYSDYANVIKRLAFTADVYLGMKIVYEAFPNLVAPPARVLRKMHSLTHFTLVLMEDGAGFDDDESDFEDWDFDVEGSPTPAEDADILNNQHGEAEDRPEPEHVNDAEEQISNTVQAADLNEVLEEDDENDEDADEYEDEEPWLSQQEDEAMERMSKGYFRHVGDIHFESAIHSPDHWDSWYPYLQKIEHDFTKQQLEDKDWEQPMVAIVEVKYGLNWIGRTPNIDWKRPEVDASSSDDDLDSS